MRRDNQDETASIKVRIPAGVGEGRRWRWRLSWPQCCIGSGRTGRSSSGVRTQPPRAPHNAKEASGTARGQRGPAPTRSRRRNADIVRQAPLQWPGTIPRLSLVDCSATPSHSMKRRSHADHGQKHETGDWMHFELDDGRPITEATEPKVRLGQAQTDVIPGSRRVHCG